MKGGDLTKNNVTWIIMTVVALLIIAALVLGAAPAHATRGCLDRAQAARTWPDRQLAVDDDGCFTYMRRGLKAAPVTAPPVMAGPSPVIEEPETLAKLDMLERWPIVIDMTSKPRVIETAPLVTPRTVVSIIIVVALTCAVFEVAFGGMMKRRG